MFLSTKLIIIGLTFNLLASIILLWPYLNIKRNVDDDFIVTADEKTRNYTQRKHLKNRKLGIIGFSLFAIGFIFQIIGILI